MEKTIEILKSDNEALIRENLSLKRKIGGYKTSNQRYRDKLERVTESYKLKVNNLAASLDALNIKLEVAKQQLIDAGDKYFRELNSVKEQLDEKDRVNEGLSSQVSVLLERIAGLQKERDHLESIIEAKNTPWWKKLF